MADKDYSVGGIKLNLPDLVTELKKILNTKNEISTICTNYGATSMSTKAFSEYPEIISELIGTGGGGGAQMQLYSPTFSYNISNNIDTYTDTAGNIYTTATYGSTYSNVTMLSNFYVDINNPSSNGAFANTLTVTLNSYDNETDTSTAILSYNKRTAMNISVTEYIHSILSRLSTTDFKSVIDTNDEYIISAKLSGKNMRDSNVVDSPRIISCTNVTYDTSYCCVKFNTSTVRSDSYTDTTEYDYFYVIQPYIIHTIAPFSDNIPINKYWLPRSIKITMTDYDGNETIDYVESHFHIPYKTLVYAITEPYRYINIECNCETYPQLDVPEIVIDGKTDDIAVNPELDYDETVDWNQLNIATFTFPYASQAIEFYDADTDEYIDKITTDEYDGETLGVLPIAYNISGYNVYPFKRTGNTFTSTNQGIANSYSAVKLQYTNNNNYTVTFRLVEIMQSSQNIYDYGVIGKINTVINSNNCSGSNILKSFSGSDATNQACTLTFPANATSFYYIIYKKNYWGNAGSDTFSFTLATNTIINFDCCKIYKLQNLYCENFDDSLVYMKYDTDNQNITIVYKIFDEYDDLVYSIEEEGV